jgi:hypothetical protein
MGVSGATEARAQRVGMAAGAGVLGVIIGLAGAIVHRDAVRPAGVLVPWGLALTLATAFSVTLAAARLAHTPGALGVPIGWVVALLWLQQGRPEGDYVFASDFLGNAYVFGGMVVLALAVVRGIAEPPLERPPS